MEKIDQIGEKLGKYSSAQIFVFFVIVGISSLFLALTFAYLLNKQGWTWAQFSFPKLFLISTVVLGLSSYTMNKILFFFKKDNFIKFKKAVLQTLILGTLFLIFQIAAWFELSNEGIYLAGKPDGSFLYLISALHALHLIAGLGLLLHLWFMSKYKMKDPVKRLIYFTNNQNFTRLKLIALYWHFVDVLWVYLLLFFLFNHL